MIQTCPFNLAAPFGLIPHHGHMANLVIVVTVQVLDTPVGSLKSTSNVNSPGKGETLLRKKTLLRELTMQPADKSVLKCVIQKVSKFAEGSCLAELSDSNGFWSLQ